MSIQVEKLENNMAKLTIEVSEGEFKDAMLESFKKQRNKINMPGFRKGKAPYAMVEKAYGPEMFYEEAANIIIPDAYGKAAEESELDIVSQPEIDVLQMEKGKPFIFTAEVTVKPEVTLGEYKGIEVEKVDTSVSEDEIMEELDKAREQNARMITIDDRKTEDGDIVSIDFEGFIDGEAFEGGSGKDYPLTLGSHTFIGDFEEQIIGKDVGEHVEVNVTFPDDYQAEELKGKDALFQVTINEIKRKELPDLDDEFVQEVSEFDTLEEYKEDIRKNLSEKKEKEAKIAKEEAVIDQIIKNANMDIPGVMIDTQMGQMSREFSQRIQAQGLSVEQYMQFTGMTQQSLIDSLRPGALKRVESRLALEAIVKAEDIEVTEAEVDKEIEDMAAAYNLEVDKMKEKIGEWEKKQIKLDIAVQKAADLVVEAAVEKEAK